MCLRGLTRTRRVRGACRLGALRPRRAGRPEPARPAGEPGMGRFEGSRTGEDSPGDERLTAVGPAGARFVRARPGGDRPAGHGAMVSGHDDVGRPCPGLRAPTASVDAPIPFTYPFPLCRSTTDIPYATSSLDVIP